MSSRFKMAAKLPNISRHSDFGENLKNRFPKRNLAHNNIGDTFTTPK